MKKVSLFCGAVLIAATLLFVACGKDKEATINKFFSVENATLVSEDMPEATSDQTIDVTMNKNVIPGGSSFVTIDAENVAKKILVGMKDQVGYYELALASGRNNEYSFVLLVDQNIALSEEENSFTVQVAIVDENDDISQIWESSVELKEVGTGALQVSLSFDNAKDVDLHLIEPEYMTEYGEPADFWQRHIYFGHHDSYNGGELDLDSNPGCSLDFVNNENITYNDSTAWVAPGTYKVYVDLFENCDPEVATNYVVTVFYGGVLLASRSGIFEVGAESTFNPIYEDYVAQNEPFLSFTIGDQGQRRVKAFEPAPLTQSAIEKMAISEANR